MSESFVFEVLQFFLIGFIGVWLPGPDMLLVFKISLNFGFRKALVVLLGILTGNIIYIMPIVLGFYFYIKNFINFLLIPGSIFIIYIGISNLISIKNFENFTKKTQNYSDKNYYFIGLFTNLSNPKAMIYFSAVLLPAFQKDDLVILFLLVFFVGVILAFLSIILTGIFLTDLIKVRFIKFINIIFSFVFIFYGSFLLVQSIRDIKATYFV